MNLLKDLVLSAFLTSQLLNASPYPTYAVHWLVEGVTLMLVLYCHISENVPKLGIKNDALGQKRS